MPQCRYYKRTFLSPASTRITSWILAECDSGEEGRYALGNYLLTLADCKRQVQFEFFLGNARDRKRSLAKIGLLMDVLSDFRTALEEEAKLIEEKR